MRSTQQIQAELRALGRPGMPIPPIGAALAAWRVSVDEWAASHPGGPQRYLELLEEFEVAERLEVAARAERDRVAAWGRNVQVPERTLRASVDPKPTQALECAREWLAGEKLWLVLLGSTGLGKSVAAAWALRQCANAGVGVAWVQAAGLASMVGGFDNVARFERLQHVAVLCLDDLGLEHDSGFGRSLLGELLQARHENQLRTILTTNLSGADFRARVGERVADRIRADCIAKELRGESMR